MSVTQLCQAHVHTRCQPKLPFTSPNAMLLKPCECPNQQRSQTELKVNMKRKYKVVECVLHSALKNASGKKVKECDESIVIRLCQTCNCRRLIIMTVDLEPYACSSSSQIFLLRIDRREFVRVCAWEL